MIVRGSKYGDSRKQASREDPHGLTPNTVEQLRDRFEEFLPGIADSHGTASKQFFNGLLPEGANLSPSRQAKQANMPGGSVNFSGGFGGGQGGNTSITPQRPYQPEFECVIEGTSIVMSDGTLKNIEEVKVGDKVLDKNGYEQEVLHHWCSGVPEKLVEICVWGGNKFYSTINHNFPVYINDKLKKIPAGEIESGYFIIPRKFDILNSTSSLDDARLLGYYLAEGNLLKNRNDLPYSEVEFTLSILEKHTIVEDIKNILLNKNIDFNITEITNRNIIRIRTRGGNSKLVKWLFYNGKHLNNLKSLSKEVLCWTVKQKIELVKGLLRGDGSQFYKVSRTKGKEGHSFEVVYITASKNLSSQIRLILAQIGYPARCTQTKSGFDKKAGFKRNPHYRLTITGQYARDIADLIWEENSKSSLVENKNSIKHRCLMDDNFIYVPIKKVSILDNKIDIPVYNITVSGDHSYLIENIGTYNSPDRQQFPVHRILANRYWRLFYKLDPVIGNCLDMYSTMPFSDFQLTGEGVTGEIKELLETMCMETNVLRILEYMVKEFMVIGEAVPHNFLDETKGIWTYTALHNPDQLEVIDAPFIKMEPVVEFIPDDRLRAVLTSNNHLLKSVRDQMPPELISRLVARQNIPLSPINMTFIPRKMHPYDTRGTSIISRMWRILLYEDSVYNASISTARRHAGPIKVAKLGNPQTGWIPSQEHERRLLQLLAQAELDPHAWLVYHYGINFELVGTTDRVMNINQHHEVIERIKLIAMGISKCFTYGTLINLADGTYKEIQDIEIGDKVLDKDGKIETVVDAWEDGIPEQIVEITLKGGKKFTITENHKFPAWIWPRTCACGCGERINKQGNIYNANHYDPRSSIEFKHVNELTTGRKSKRIPIDYDPFQVLKAINLEKGDCLLIPRKFNEIKPDIKLSQARLLGYYVSEGHIIKGEEFGGKANGDGFEFSLNANEIDTLAVDIQNICADLGIDMNIRSTTHKSGIKVTTQSKNSIHIARWLKDYGGEYASTKKLSAEVMYWPLEYKRELIRGLYRGDGCQYWSDTVEKKNGEFSRSFSVRYSTTSHTLARQIQLILAQLGFYASLDIKKPTGWGKLHQLNAKTHGVHAHKLADLIWEESSQSNYYKHKSSINNFRVDDDYIYLPVTKIKIKKNDKPVFNLSVSGSHSYLANNVASMNSFLHGEVTYACLRKGEQILIGDYTYKSIENVEEGDQIIDKDGKVQTVEAAWCEGTPKTAFEIKLWGNKKITATENHRWPVWAWPRTCACGCGQEVRPGKCFVQHHHERIGCRYNQIELQYVDGETAIGGKPRQIPKGYDPIQKLRSDELRAGDYLLIPRKFKPNRPSVSLEQARLLGYYIAEGCKSSNNKKVTGIKWVFNINEAGTYGKDVVKICNSLGLKAKIAEYENRQVSVVSALCSRSKDLFTWFKKHGGEYSYAKCLSKTVMHWPVKYKVELLKGMYYGDGSQFFHNTKNRYGNPYKQFMVVYTTVSETLAHQLQIILAQLGFYAVIDTEKKRIGKDGSERRKLFLIKTYGNHARNLSKLIWGNESKDNIVKNNIRDRFRVDDDYIYIPIRSIERIENDDPVYNLSVTGSHSYIVNGVGTYNSSITGLSVFLQRMKSLRNFFVKSWLIPKFFKPIAQINGWVKRDKKELTYRYRIKRSQREIEMENRWIIPNIEWEKQLDANINNELVTAMNSLEQMGIQFSKTTKYASVGRKFEEEVRKIKEEQQYEQELNKYAPPSPQGSPGGPGGGAPPLPKPGGGPAPTGAPGAPGAPGVGEGAMPTSPGGGNIPNAPGGAPGTAADKTSEGGGSGPSGKRDPAERNTESALWDHKGRAGNWSASEVTELSNLLKEGITNSPLWGDMDSAELRRAVNIGDVWEVIELLEEHLRAEGYPSSDITQLKRILDREGILRDIADGETAHLKEIEDKMGDGISNLNDSEAMDRLSSQIEGYTPKVSKMRDPDALFIGHGNSDSRWGGDISDMIDD